MKKLFLLDAYALIYRAYYALIRAPRFTSKGFNTSAIFGFCNTLDEILRKEKPTHIAVCFDPHGPTFRHEMYDQYKAQREAQPEDISAAVPIIKEIVKAYDIPIFEVPGYEADDVIGTLSRMASQEGFTTYMMTPDKDYGQLVTDNVLMYKPSLRGQDFEIRGPKEVCEKYGIQSPTQVIDLLALEGDSIDNIPGCPGVGPKTASKLIGEFGSVENLLDHASEIKGAVGRKIETNAEQIRFSKKLATIRTDVPLDVDFNTLQRGPVDVESLRQIFTDLEFKTFIARLSAMAGPNIKAPKAVTSEAVTTDNSADKAGAQEKSGAKKEEKASGKFAGQPSLFDFMDAPQDDTTQPVAPSATPSPTLCTEISSAEDISRLKEEASRKGFLGIALYAVGAEAMVSPLRAIAFSTAEGTAKFINIPSAKEARSLTMMLLKPLFNCKEYTVVSHDIKRDIILLRNAGVTLTAPYFDTRLAHYILQPEMRHRITDIAMNVLGFIPDIEDAETARKPYGPLPKGREDQVLCHIADITLRLRAPLVKLLEQNGQLSLLNDIELPMAEVLADMEWTGVRVDVDELHRLSALFSAQLTELEHKCYELAGEKFNIGSPMQVGEILFGKMKLDPKAKRTKTGAYSTTEEILLKHRARHPIIQTILDVRSLRKLLATYVDALPELVNPVTGKIHTTFNQTVTATGRLSSTNPNLQNIPIRTDDGREVRSSRTPDAYSFLPTIPRSSCVCSPTCRTTRSSPKRSAPVLTFTVLPPQRFTTCPTTMSTTTSAARLRPPTSAPSTASRLSVCRSASTYHAPRPASLSRIILPHILIYANISTTPWRKPARTATLPR